MYPTQTHDTTHHTHTPDPTTPPGLAVQAALVAAPPAALVAATNPLAALLTVAVVAALAWHRRFGRARPRARPTGPPD